MVKGAWPTWHTTEAGQVLRALGTDAGTGLRIEEASRRLRERGPNQLEDGGARSPWSILWGQFTSTMIVILIVAALAFVWFLNYWNLLGWRF
jgi:Ca2+-transporting ATPase